MKKYLVNILVILSCLLSLGISSADPAGAFLMPETQAGLMETIVVDGELDADYSLTIAADPAAETFEPAVNLTNFWATQDDTHFYFYIEVAADLSVDTWGKYNISKKRTTLQSSLSSSISKSRTRAILSSTSTTVSRHWSTKLKPSSTGSSPLEDQGL